MFANCRMLFNVPFYCAEKIESVYQTCQPRLGDLNRLTSPPIRLLRGGQRWSKLKATTSTSFWPQSEAIEAKRHEFLVSIEKRFIANWKQVVSRPRQVAGARGPSVHRSLST